MKEVTPWQFKSFQDIQDGQVFIARNMNGHMLCMRAFETTVEGKKRSLALTLHDYSPLQVPVCIESGDVLKRAFVAVYLETEIDFGGEADSIDLDNRIEVKPGIALRYEDRSVILALNFQNRLNEVDVVTGEVHVPDFDSPHATCVSWTVRAAAPEPNQKGSEIFSYPPPAPAKP